MRQRNMRLVIVGAILVVLAIGFFAYMTSIASSSNDPQELMRTVGMVSGGVGGLAVVLVVLGLIGRKA